MEQQDPLQGLRQGPALPQRYLGAAKAGGDLASAAGTEGKMGSREGRDDVMSADLGDAFGACGNLPPGPQAKAQACGT